MKKSMKRLISIVLLFSLFVLLTGCGSDEEAGFPQEEGSPGYDRADEAVEGSPGDHGFSDDTASRAPDSHGGAPSGDKIIYRQTLTMETENLQQTVDKMEQDLDRLGGRIHRYQVITRQEDSPRGDFTLRVPSDSLRAFVEGLRNYGTFTHEVLESDDVSDSYYDLEANLRNLKIQERRLLDLLEEAENLSDVLTLESELSRIRREIEGLQGTLNRLDDQIAYSTVYLSIRQVEKLDTEEAPFSERLLENFRDSLKRFRTAWETLLLWSAAYFPFLILGALLLLGLKRFAPAFLPGRKNNQKIQ